MKQYIEKRAIKIADIPEVAAKEDVFNTFTVGEAFLKKVRTASGISERQKLSRQFTVKGPLIMLKKVKPK